MRGALFLDRERTAHAVVFACLVVAASALAMLGVRGLLSIASVHSWMNSGGPKAPRRVREGPPQDVGPRQTAAPTPR